MDVGKEPAQVQKYQRPDSLKYHLGQVVSVIVNKKEITGVITGWTEKCTQNNRWVRKNYGNTKNGLHTKTSLDIASKPFYTIILEKNKVDDLINEERNNPSKCEKLEFLKNSRKNSFIYHKIWKYQVYVPQDQIAKVYCIRENWKNLPFDPCFNDYFYGYDHENYVFQTTQFLKILYPGEKKQREIKN